MFIKQAHAQPTDDLGSFTCTSANSVFCPDVRFSEAAVSVNKSFTLILGFFTIVAGLGFLIYFVISALKWLTAGGDAQKVEEAQRGMTNGLIGLIIVVAAYAIAWIVGEVLGLNILNPAESLTDILKLVQ